MTLAEELVDILECDDPTETRHWLRKNAMAVIHSLRLADRARKQAADALVKVPRWNTCLREWEWVQPNIPEPMQSRVDLAHECFDLENPDEEEKNAGPRGLEDARRDYAAAHVLTHAGQYPDVDPDTPIRAERPIIWGPGHGTRT